MPGWDDAFAALRGDFVRESGPKLVEVEQLLERLAAGPDEGTLQGLYRRLHAFAGAGTTYGFPEVTEIGRAGERLCGELVREKRTPSADDITAFRGQLDALKKAFDASLPAPAPIAEVSPPPPPQSRLTDVLVVDDDEEILRLVTRLLDQEGMSARTARNKAEALAAFQAQLPQGLIVDILLPDGSGYDLVEHLRSQPGGDIPPILVVSVLSAFLDKVEAIHCGSDGFFEKPVDWEALMRRLQHLLDRERRETARILSVEDDPHQSAFVRMILESAGYEVHICEDPRHFESELVAFRPDLVLMDIVLPGLSGYDLARYMRQDERYTTVPILFLTTQDQIDARIRSARAGGDEHLAKPIAPALLLSTTAARIERARFVKGLLSRDGLTRLLTHSAFIERARSAVSLAHRYPTRPVAWVMLDIDHFKSVNDSHGHPVGDRVLASLSSLLRRRLRQTDTVGRYGGEEFAILLTELEGPDAVRLVSRLLAEFREIEHKSPSGAKFKTTFSAGIAVLDPRMDLEAWRLAADQALYAAKSQGRNKVVLAG